MNEPKNGLSCGLGCWALAAGAGFLTFVLLLVLGDYRFMAAIFLSGVLFVALGLLLSWILCRDLPGPAIGAGEMSPGTPAPKASEAKPDVQTATATADAEAGASVKPSKPLAGEADLDARKGSWKYGEEAGAESPGTKPDMYDAAPAGGGDDLKKIKGVGPKLSDACNSIGVYTFAQIAAWGPDEVAWVDDNLIGFKGRVTRDDWVAQAKLLAGGGETEFSKRVGEGGVYDKG